MSTAIGQLAMEEHDSAWEKTKRAVEKIPLGAIGGTIFWGTCAALNFWDAAILATAGLGAIGVLYTILFASLGFMGLWLMFRSIKYNSFLA